MSRPAPNRTRTARLAGKAAFAVLAGSALLPAHAAAPAARPTHVVVDSSGTPVKLVRPLHRIADLWYAHNSLVIMLGSGKDIVATIADPRRNPWMYKIEPSLKQAMSLPSGAPSVEAIKRANVDAAFVGPPRLVEDLRRLHIPVVQAGFQNVEELKRCVTVTADALGTQRAHDTAQKFLAALQAKVAMIHKRIDPLKPSQRPTVLHISSLSPLRVDGGHTIFNTWLHLAGGRNAADVIPNLGQVTMEEVAALNPDVIILGGTAGKFDPKANGLWQTMKAVRTGHVYRNPAGVFPFDRYGPEFLLQIQWAAKTLHPALFRDIDMKAETLAFYRTFFRYDMTPHEADLILAAQPPDGMQSAPSWNGGYRGEHR